MKSRSRILVIDDDPTFRSLIVSILRKDYLVSVASGGENGYEKAREHRPDLVIIDYFMPGWNGIETLKMFRNDRMLAKTKIVMLTSDASKDTVLSAIKAGTDEYIIKKTFRKEDFIDKVNNLLAPQTAVASKPAPASASAMKGPKLEPAIAQPSTADAPKPTAASEPISPEQNALLEEMIDEWE